MVSIGLIAAFFTTVSFIPQALKTLKTRDTSGISLPMYIMFFLGVSLWIVYGLEINDSSIVIGNSCVLMFIVPILYIKIKAVSAEKVPT
ncbi:SemiSWEET transporter [Photobacterium sp. DNB23_23_1]|uniref:SemiSWEET transporter n=1 Tax=Photobacterium pectinilyticum TaxID=2906793 RepID=A0ABT1N7V0_9GAMM|nr:SemiSWEET transporter [Photobacterium sp. ZSDE20]MCQ1060828.1 SemiSWEET transporter [Photobacterium sp. ZSDE20]MDD1828598.1 SemiSWEET transporter [Photobacterium sp. ZSDE20]